MQLVRSPSQIEVARRPCRPSACQVEVTETAEGGLGDVLGVALLLQLRTHAAAVEIGDTAKDAQTVELVWVASSLGEKRSCSFGLSSHEPSQKLLLK